ncbi:MAG: LPS export ABC transporter periplasmic protein LptC [Acidobacteriota bacterium]|nr:LPS export ABC transporter periplasmic protein LptC [Acidobacteriota bacterium]
MTSWQKRTRAVLAVVVVGVIGAVGYTLRPREARVAPAAVEKLPDKVTVITKGGDAIQLKGSSQDLRIEFERQESYESGQTKLFVVRIKVDNRGGRNFTVTGKEMFLGKDQSSFDVAGDVKLETSDGLTAYGQSASYAETEKIVKVPGPVKFARGRMSGTGVGFTYDEQRDTLWILDQAVVNFAPAGGAGAAKLTAGGFGFARRDRYMRLERTMHMERDGQVTDANEATVTLFPDRDESDYIELRGNSRVTGGAGMGLLKSLSATDMNLDYREDGRSLQHATLAGQADIQLATKGASPGQRLQAGNMDIALAPDDSVSSLSARDKVEVTLPATAETAARTIKSTALTAAGAAQGLNTMNFSEGVSYDEAATKTQGARTARSRNLDASLDPAAGTLNEAKFTRTFVFEDGAMRASSANATYKIAAGQLELTGREGAAVPQIKDDTLTIDADRIDVTLSPRKMVASGKVQSVLQPSKKPTGNAPAAKRPGLLQDKDPVNVIADKLTYDEASRKGEYAGQARLFQGDTQINGDAITLDETKGDLIVTGKVITTLLIAEKDAKPGAPIPPMIGRAGSFTYTDQARQATYRTLAHLAGSQSDLHADTLDLFLAAGENTLERLEATGAVTATVDKRTVTGTKLSHVPADDKYVVLGAPVRMIDADCQETTGRTLTFFKSSDRVIVDGNQEIRTQAKSGGKCPSAPPK